MVQTAPKSSFPDRFTPTHGGHHRMPNTVHHRFAGNGAGHRYASREILHRVAGRDVVLRRIAARRRLARIDPEAVERRAWRLTGGDGGASSPIHS
ncbi:MAG TPA: hypothetical protein VFC19_00755 [Candidatus Limnocylindrales bacterium]|nr:hypothetical protein [Candidatus Limnocylindrales bacterium]